jgi:hypothetical protein
MDEFIGIHTVCEMYKISAEVVKHNVSEGLLIPFAKSAGREFFKYAHVIAVFGEPKTPMTEQDSNYDRSTETG